MYFFLSLEKTSAECVKCIDRWALFKCWVLVLVSLFTFKNILPWGYIENPKGQVPNLGSSKKKFFFFEKPVTTGATITARGLKAFWHVYR